MSTKSILLRFQSEVFLHGPALRTDSESLILDWVGRLPLDGNTPDVEITTSFWPGERSRSYWYEHPDQAAQCYTWIGILGRDLEYLTS